MGLGSFVHPTPIIFRVLMISMFRPRKSAVLALRTGDTIEGHIRSPKEGERYFALLKVNTLNFEDPEKSKHKGQF